MLTDLCHKASRSEPLIRVYDSKVLLNSAASAILGINEQSCLSFKTNDRETGGHVYVGSVGTARRCYPVRRRANTFYISDCNLARNLAERLQGKGTYRLSKEDNIEYNGVIYYNIFFRKYD